MDWWQSPQYGLKQIQLFVVGYIDPLMSPENPMNSLFCLVKSNSCPVYISDLPGPQRQLLHKDPDHSLRHWDMLGWRKKNSGIWGWESEVIVSRLNCWPSSNGGFLSHVDAPKGIQSSWPWLSTKRTWNMLKLSWWRLGIHDFRNPPGSHWVSMAEIWHLDRADW